MGYIIDVRWIDQDNRFKVYSYIINDGYYYFVVGYINRQQFINVFSPKNNRYDSYYIKNLIETPGTPNLSMCEKIDNYFIIYNPNDNLYKVDITDLNNLVAIPFDNMKGIKITSMTADNNKQLVFFG